MMKRETSTDRGSGGGFVLPKGPGALGVVGVTGVVSSLVISLVGSLEHRLSSLLHRRCQAEIW